MAPFTPRRDLEMFGYSSSSDSEDEPPRKSAPASSSNTNQKKKKRPKPPPQQSINKIWRRFSKKKFTKALSVLPFDPVPLPSIPERPNELLSAGYERAVEECRRKVQKIIQECRRVNTRYRDPGFDLDWDLKWKRGNCLNYLGSNKFDLTGPRLSSSTAVPKAVKRVHEIFEDPTFMKTINGKDVKQGGLGDCWLVASLSALANVENGIQQLCVEYDTRIGIYGFVFFRDGEWIYSIVDDKLCLTSPCWDSPSMQRDLLQQIDREDVERVYRKTYQTGSKALFFGQCKDQNETWVPLFEKAYAKAHGDYGSLSGGWIGEGVEDLSGGVTTELLASDILDTEGFWENELSKVNQEFLFGCSTGLLDGGYGERDGIREGHAYVVMDARKLKSGVRLVQLRNPWGKTRKGIWDGPWSDGSKEWTSEVKEELGHNFGNDSVFWITYEDMLRKYQHFDRTRLFRDPNWRCCQRWIGVEVPWKSHYHEKFHITLTKESPLVLVLSQLDNRYYKGLHGQYNFRLQFRLHEQGRHDAEDYIVRSHGNYLMDRSVSIELPSMPPGHYSVFINVLGERDSDLLSVEDVVKRECKKRTENDKLAQVGYAYDLAHSKGVAHLEQLAKLRKHSDQKKASNSRVNERKKLWEKRHVNREVNRKQTKKNKAKKDQHRAAIDAERAEKKAAAEAKAKAEAEAKAQEEAEAKANEDKSVHTDKADVGDKAVQADGASTNSPASSVSSGSPKYTPKSETSELAADDGKSAATISAVSGGPPPPPAPPAAESNKKASSASEEPYPSDGESSDSPVEDWELLYSSDDMSKKPRMAPPPAPGTVDDKYAESEDENLPEPWNAICIVGVRVYSMDEGLQLRVVMEGGELAEGGMGEKGARDIDNAQSNAGGEREREAKTNSTNEEVEIVDGKPIVKQKLVVDEATKKLEDLSKDLKNKTKDREDVKEIDPDTDYNADTEVEGFETAKEDGDFDNEPAEPDQIPTPLETPRLSKDDEYTFDTPSTQQNTPDSSAENSS